MNLQGLTYSSRSVSRYVLGRYTRFCFVRKTKKISTKAPASKATGIRVDKKAETEELLFSEVVDELAD